MISKPQRSATKRDLVDGDAVAITIQAPVPVPTASLYDIRVFP